MGIRRLRFNSNTIVVFCTNKERFSNAVSTTEFKKRIRDSKTFSLLTGV